MTDQASIPLRHRYFAWLWARIAKGADIKYRQPKDDVLTDLPDRILELGPGLGANFGRYPAGAHVLGFEPNTALHEGLRAAADDHGIELEIRSDDLRAADLRANSEDLVVSTLVLCCVGDQASMVAEILRILRPGGRFIFVEHVAATEPGSRRVQQLLRYPWSTIGDGCDLRAATVGAIDQAGFASVESTHGDIGSKLDPTHSSYWGVAVK